jgi:hypothetical protein
MARFVELRRHTDNDGDVLTDEGVAAALRIGAGLPGGYRLGSPPAPSGPPRRWRASWPPSAGRCPAG